MNTLVIGGAGYIGSHVVLALLEAGHRVRVFDNLSTGREENLQQEAEFFRGDIMDPAGLQAAMEEPFGAATGGEQAAGGRGAGAAAAGPTGAGAAGSAGSAGNSRTSAQHSGAPAAGATPAGGRGAEDGGTGTQAVIHLAALKAAGESMEKPGEYARQNIMGTVNILEAMAAAGTKLMVFSSSAAVYGNPEYLPIDEEHPAEPENFYGFTKLEIERILAWYLRLKGIRYAALRYFNAAGYDPAGRITGLERQPQNLLPVIMECAAGRRREVQIFGNDYDTPDGTGVRDYVHVSDLAAAHLSALELIAGSGPQAAGSGVGNRPQAAGSRPESDGETSPGTLANPSDAGRSAGEGETESLTLNLGSGKGFSVMEVLEAARRISGRPIPARVTGRRPGDPAKLMAASARAREILGWSPRCSDLDTLVETTWRVYKAANPAGSG